MELVKKLIETSPTEAEAAADIHLKASTEAALSRACGNRARDRRDGSPSLKQGVCFRPKMITR